MNENDSLPPPLPHVVTEFQNRQGAMVGVGLFIALFGVVAALVGFLFLMAGVDVYSDAGRGHSSQADRFASLFFLAMGMIHLPLGMLFVVLGIGSVRCRRWARALLAAGLPVFAVVCGLLLVLGVCYFPWLMSLVDFRRGPGVPLVILGVFAAIVILVMNVLIPWFAGRFYSGDNARQTCEGIQSQPSWTDRRPLAVLRFGFVVLVVGFLWLAAIPLWIIPFVGINFVGPTAIGFSVFMFMIHVWLARSCWLQRKSGWRGVVGLWIGSLLVAYARLPYQDLWLTWKNGRPVGNSRRLQAQIEEYLTMLTDSGMPLMNGAVLFLLIAGTIFLALGAAVSVKNYFDNEPIEIPPGF